MSKRANMYGLHRVAAQFDAVEDRHIAFALAAGWTLDRAKREFARFASRRSRAEAGQELCRSSPLNLDPRARRIRELGHRYSIPERVIDMAIRENWSVLTASRAFLKSMRGGTI